jgi:hypothetical protein
MDKWELKNGCYAENSLLIDFTGTKHLTAGWMQICVKMLSTDW